MNNVLYCHEGTTQTRSEGQKEENGLIDCHQLNYARTFSGHLKLALRYIETKLNFPLLYLCSQFFQSISATFYIYISAFFTSFSFDIE